VAEAQPHYSLGERGWRRKKGVKGGKEEGSFITIDSNGEERCKKEKGGEKKSQ